MQRAQKRASTSVPDVEENYGKRQRRNPSLQAWTCFLCEKQVQESSLRQAMTMQLNDRRNRYARTLCDDRLLAILSAGDTVAQELKYHPACLAALYNRERSHLSSQHNEESIELATVKVAYRIYSIKRRPRINAALD